MPTTRIFSFVRASTALALILLVSAGIAAAQEATLRAVSAFDEGTRFSINFERFIAKVNAEGKGLVQLRYIGGGGKVMNPFELGNALRGGVVDVINAAGAYYTNLLPEADALKLTRRTSQELRQNGGWEYINRLHNEKLNAYYLARQGDGVPFHLYLTRRIDKPDLTGLKIRVTPVYHAFFAALGATPLRTPPGEVYTALERGVVDGYGWAIQGVLDLGWQEVTKFRVDPGFYNVDVGVLVNLRKWNGLREEQRAFLQRMGLWLESLNAENPRINQEEAAKQAAAGIQVIAFTPEQSAHYLKVAEEAGWGQVMKVSPEHGPRLKALFTK
jgi:TRAP-type C4-dicarboxylate transport system substrate-binding protein